MEKYCAIKTKRINSNKAHSLSKSLCMTEAAVVVKTIDRNNAKHEICGVSYFGNLPVNKYDV